MFPKRRLIHESGPEWLPWEVECTGYTLAVPAAGVAPRWLSALPF